MFLFKKIVAPFFFPVPFCLLVLAVGVVVLWLSQRQRVGKGLVTLGTAMLFLCSYSVFSVPFLKTLELRYSPLFGDEAILTTDGDVRWVVVLGGGHTLDPRIPPASQLSSSSLVRLIEGIRLYRSIPGSRLIVSEGAVFSTESGAKIMADVAKALGVPEEDVVLEDQSRDTEDEAMMIKEIVGDDRFVLVTSASHMVRSMKLFEKQGMRPLPAPTDYLVKKAEYVSPGMFFPGPEGLYGATRVVYEFLGIAWAHIVGSV